MKKWSVKVGLLVISLLISGAWLMWGSLNYSGYCFEQSAYLSNDAIVRSAIPFFLDSYPPIISYTDIEKGPDGFTSRLFRKRPSNSIAYLSIDDFLQANPDCCKFSTGGPEGDSPSAWQRFTGGNSGFVFVEYNVIFIGRDGARRTQKVSEFMPVSNCGRIR